MKRKKTKPSEMKRLEKELQDERRKSEECRSRFAYLQADFDNYRKRREKELVDASRLSKEKLIVSLLGVIDELELALRSGKQSEDKQALIKGVEMTLRKMMDTLKRESLTKIEVEGKLYNPELHEIVKKVSTKRFKANTITEEVRAGYFLGGKIVRPAMVNIATGERGST